MSTRSLNVPGSLSSALATRKWGNDRCAATACHLRPVGNAAPPRPTRPLFDDFVDHRRRPDLDRLAQSVVSAVLDVRLERGGIDDAGSREQHEPGLAALGHGPRRVPLALGQRRRERDFARLHDESRRCPFAQAEARRGRGRRPSITAPAAPPPRRRCPRTRARRGTGAVRARTVSRRRRRRTPRRERPTGDGRRSRGPRG